MRGPICHLGTRNWLVSASFELQLHKVNILGTISIIFNRDAPPKKYMANRRIGDVLWDVSEWIQTSSHHDIVIRPMATGSESDVADCIKDEKNLTRVAHAFDMWAYTDACHEGSLTT
jgi:hypothetical protein